MAYVAFTVSKFYHAMSASEYLTHHGEFPRRGGRSWVARGGRASSWCIGGLHVPQGYFLCSWSSTRRTSSRNVQILAQCVAHNPRTHAYVVPWCAAQNGCGFNASSPRQGVRGLRTRATVDPQRGLIHKESHTPFKCRKMVARGVIVTQATVPELQ